MIGTCLRFAALTNQDNLVTEDACGSIRVGQLPRLLPRQSLGTRANSFPGSAWERSVLQAPACSSALARRSLATSGFPGRAWEPE